MLTLTHAEAVVVLTVKEKDRSPRSISIDEDRSTTIDAPHKTRLTGTSRFNTIHSSLLAFWAPRDMHTKLFVSRSRNTSPCGVESPVVASRRGLSLHSALPIEQKSLASVYMN